MPIPRRLKMSALLFSQFFFFRRFWGLLRPLQSSRMSLFQVNTTFYQCPNIYAVFRTHFSTDFLFKNMTLILKRDFKIKKALHAKTEGCIYEYCTLLFFVQIIESTTKESRKGL